MELGKITGCRIGKNRDGDKDRIILQIEIIPGEDVRTIELFSGAGDDSNPANGCRVCVIPVSDSYQIASGISDGLLPETDPGDKEIYSTNNPVTQKKAQLRLKANGKTFLKNETENFKTIIDDLIDAIEDMTTFGSPSNHSVSPASKIALEAIKTRIGNLLTEA